MAKSAAQINQARSQTAPPTFFEEISLFFQRRDRVHQTMRRVTKKLEKAKIPYAIVGGMAVFAQGYRRTTDDLDILLTSEGLAAFRRRFVPKAYAQVPKRLKRFLDPANGVTFDILVTGLYPGSGKPGPVAYPDPAAVHEIIAEVRVVVLPMLIQLKLAARRYQNFADVVSLIRANDLDESLQARLHPSLRRDYIECLEEKRREDEYEERQDQQVKELLVNEEYRRDED